MIPGATGRSQRGAQIEAWMSTGRELMLQGCSSTLFSHWAEPAVLEFSKTSHAHLVDLTDSLLCICGDTE